MSDLDDAFLDGLENGSVYAVFHPIVDANRSLVGFEILTRWRMNQEVLLPDDFLPLLKREASWLALARYLVSTAVRKINEYEGVYFFSFNISNVEASSNEFIQLVANSKECLMSVDWIRKMVIEFSERINVKDNFQVVSVMKALREIGCVIYLDDILSHDSTIYPVQVIKFDGVKIDKAIIKQMKKNNILISLIKTTIYFCSLTDIVCIAEGIENDNQLNVLVSFGVRYFQGYLISKPIEDIMLGSFVISCKNS